MKITPLDVGNHRFPKRWRGYDQSEVDVFLEMVRQEMEEIIQENTYLTEELKKKSASLSEYRQNEQLLKDSMINAQRISEDMKNSMVKEAQAILAQAELEAEAIIHKAHERVIQLQEDVQDLKEQRVRAREELRSVLNTHMALIEVGLDRVEEEREAREDSNLRVLANRKVRKARE